MAEGKRAGHGIWTPANIGTSIRVVFVPAWLLAAWVAGIPSHEGTGVSWPHLVVALLFILLSLTDKLDGYLARSRGEVTTFGKFLDPIADKLVVVCSMLVLMDWDYLNFWPLVIVVSREFLVSGLRLVVAAEGTVVAASNLGKWKTATTMTSISGYFLHSCLGGGALAGGLYWLSFALMAAAIVLTAWSGFDYFWKSRDALFADEEYEGGSSAKGGAEAAPSWGDCVALAAEVLDEARSRGLTVGTAESCTGGLVEGSLTAVPGSSDVVKGAIGSYACSVKHAVLGVSDEILDTVGPVSPECAAAMAEGARTALGCDLSVSVTGIAGPGGAEPGKPVGLVWFGVSSSAGTRTESVVFPGDRSEVRLRAVRHALQLLRD